MPVKGVESRAGVGRGGGGYGGGKIENEKAAIYTSKLRLNASPPSSPKREGGSGGEGGRQRERERYRQENQCIFTSRRCAAPLHATTRAKCLANPGRRILPSSPSLSIVL